MSKGKGRINNKSTLKLVINYNRYIMHMKKSWTQRLQPSFIMYWQEQNCYYFVSASVAKCSFQCTWSGLQKMWASSCWNLLTRVSPVNVPDSSLRWRTPKSAILSGSSRHDRGRWSNITLKNQRFICYTIKHARPSAPKVIPKVICLIVLLVIWKKMTKTAYRSLEKITESRSCHIIVITSTQMPILRPYISHLIFHHLRWSCGMTVVIPIERLQRQPLQHGWAEKN